MVDKGDSNCNEIIQNGFDHEEELFSPSVIKRIQWDHRKSVFSPEISPLSPGNGLRYRPLQIGDFDRGHIDLLSQLTDVGQVTKEDYERRFRSMKSCPQTYYIVVIEDVALDRVISSGSLILEQKFIHDAGQRGRVEDVVVSDEYRGRQLGKLLLESLTLLAESLGCYKVSLECKDHLMQFYQTFGYNQDGNNFMVQRFS